MTDSNRIREMMRRTFYPGQESIMDEADDEELDDIDDELDDLDDEIDDMDVDAPDMGDAGGDEPDLGGEDDLGNDFGGGPDDLGDAGGIETGNFGDEEGLDDESGEAPPEEEISDEEPAEMSPVPDMTDEQKIQEFFTDTGDMAFDYGLENPANIALAKFKFQNAGIEVVNLLTPEEMSVGVPSKDLEDRLSPDQKEQYIIANRKLRDEFPQLAHREKNILIYNSKILMVKNDVTGNETDLEGEDLKKAYQKLDDYMVKRYGQYWQEKRVASDFLQTIKINFSDKESIRPNLITADNFTPLEDKNIPPLPFNKVTVPIPNSIDAFIRMNLENPDFLRSSIFSSLAGAYKSGVGRGNDVYAIINGEDESMGEVDDIVPMDDEGAIDAEGEAPEEPGAEEGDEEAADFEAPEDEEGTEDGEEETPSLEL